MLQTTRRRLTAAALAAGLMLGLGGPAAAEVELTMYYPVAVGGPLTKIVDGLVADWIKQRDQKEVLAAFEEAEAAIGPAYDIAQIFEDPQYQARDDIVALDDEDLGHIRMTAAFPVMSGTPAEIRHAGPRKGQHNDEIYKGEFGLSEAELAALREDGVI